MLTTGVAQGLSRARRQGRSEGLGSMGVGSRGEGEAQGLAAAGSVQSEQGMPSSPRAVRVLSSHPHLS